MFFTGNFNKTAITTITTTTSANITVKISIFICPSNYCTAISISQSIGFNLRIFTNISDSSIRQFPLTLKIPPNPDIPPTTIARSIEISTNQTYLIANNINFTANLSNSGIGSINIAGYYSNSRFVRDNRLRCC